MANWQKIKERALSSVDTAIHIAERIPEPDDNQNVDFSYDKSVNPFPFLLDLLRRVCGYNDVIKYVARFIAYVLPAVEVAIKAALLANLKNLLYCTIDPRFKKGDVIRNGITIELDDIDILNTLQYCPLNKNNLFGETLNGSKNGVENYGSMYYYGCDGFNYPSELVDAGDFNAFLWYVINRSNKREVWRGIDTKGKNIFNTLHQSERFGNNSTNSYILQKELADRPPRDEQDTKDNGILTLIYYGDGMTTPRNYNGVPIPGEVRRNNVLQIYIGNTTRTDLNDSNFKNFEKVYQEKCNEVLEKEKELKKIKKEKNDFAKLIRKIKDPLELDKQKATFDRLDSEVINIENELTALRLTTESYAREYERQKNGLCETYNASSYKNIETNYYYDKTLMRFNYDYIMSLKLFDSKVVAAQLIDVLFNTLSGSINGSINIHLSYQRRVIEEEVKKMVEQVLERGDTTISDCFFAFTNTELDNFQRKVELQRAGLFSLHGESDTTNIFDVETLYSNINNIATNATQEEIQTIIEGTLTNISKEFSSVESRTDTESDFKNPVKWDFIAKLIENLMVVVTEILCSPKVYLAYLINFKMLGEPDNKFNLKKFLEFKSELIASTILKTSDIWADYLSSIFERLADDLKQLVWAKLVNEQYEYYKRLLEQCIECFKLNKKYLDFNLDDVDYADILSEENANNENNEC